MPADGRLRGVIFILSDRCNSRCLMCDYWRETSPSTLDASKVIAFWDRHVRQHPQFVTLSGGEPLLYPELFSLAEFFHSRTDSVVLSTNGFLLARHAAQVSALFDKVIISVDGARRETIRSIRGCDVLDQILAGARAVRTGSKTRLIFKMTIQAGNYAEIPEFIRLARGEGADGVALAVPDLETGAFVRDPEGAARSRDGILLTRAQCGEFEHVVAEVENRFADLIAAGFVVEGHLRRFVDYFQYHSGLRPSLPPRTCDIAVSRLVVSSDGAVRPCFFLDPIAKLEDLGSGDFFDSKAARLFRAGFDSSREAVCGQCAQFLDWKF
jgi:MoaA/NifB/PqqE/SkfB family radical SAM enzyme